MGLSLTGKHPQNDCGSEPQKCLSLGSGRPHESVRSKQSRPISGGASERILAMAPVRNLPLNFPRVVCNPTKEAHHEVGRTEHDFTQHSVMRSTNARREESTDWNGARVERVPFGEGPTRSGTAKDYGCCESKRSGDGHSAGVPAGRGEAGVKWPWMLEA
ncbi:MAG: hypothetical protein ACJAVK_002951 [Akkermansiaceae bacterium]|jgi:hypothetical protein